MAASSHGLGLDEAVALAFALDRMPGRLIVHAVEAGDLAQGTGLSPAVATAVDALAAAVMRDVAAAMTPGSPLWFSQRKRFTETSAALAPLCRT
jgi:Ni,Fe-hydrogenase maturation factor